MNAINDIPTLRILLDIFTIFAYIKIEEGKLEAVCPNNITT